jgi:DNA-binding NtrC family response regulator
MEKTNESTIRLLLVDDEEAFVSVLAKRLARRNILVTPAFNGAEALQCLRRGDFDVAVLDLKMEGLDGIEVLKILEKMAPELPVIMLTGHGCQDSARQSTDLGAFDYLSKPYDFELLLLKIREAVRSAGKKP